MLKNIIVNKYILIFTILLTLFLISNEVVVTKKYKGKEKMNNLINIKKVTSYNLKNVHYGFELIDNVLKVWINDELMFSLDESNSSNYEFELFNKKQLPIVMQHFVVDVKENIFNKENIFPLNKKHRFMHIKLDNGLFDKNYQLIWVDLYLMEKNNEWIGYVIGQSCAEDDCPDMSDKEMFPLNEIIRFRSD